MNFILNILKAVTIVAPIALGIVNKDLFIIFFWCLYVLYLLLSYLFEKEITTKPEETQRTIHVIVHEDKQEWEIK